MRNFWLNCLIVLVVAGCSMSGSDNEENRLFPSDAVITTLTCDEITAYASATVTCLAVPPDAVLLQLSEQTQLTLRVEGITLTFDSTVYWSAVPGERMVIAPLDGVSVVGVAGMTYIIHPGEQIALPLDEGVLSGSVAPSTLQSYDRDEVARAPYRLLPRPVVLPVPIIPVDQPPPALPTADASPVIVATATPANDLPEGCVPREDWGYFYTIQRGDNLTRIANLHEISVADLQDGNCITDPNRISPGEVIRVPIESDHTIPATVTPGAEFYADEETLQSGECAVLNWKVGGAGVVYYEGDPVTQTDTRDVCPTVTTTYTLSVYYLDGALVDYTVTIAVAGP